MGFLLDRLQGNKRRGDVMHSSVYGDAQNSGAFGTTSLSSFGDRLKADWNRKTIRKYSDAKVVNDVGRKKKIAQMTSDDIAGGSPGARGSSSAGATGRPPARRNPGIFR